MTTAAQALEAQQAKPSKTAAELLDSLISYAGSTLRTNIKDRDDWAADVRDMLGLAERIRESAAAEVSTLRAECAGAKPPAGVIISAYTIGQSRSLNAITIQRAGQIEGPDLWAVRRNGECLNRSGEWEWEPMPSSRDDAFLSRCRFGTHQEAITAAINQGGEG